MFLLAAVAMSAIAAVFDFRTGLIPNWVTLGGVVVGVVGHALYGWKAATFQVGLQEAGFALGGMVFCSIAPGLLYYKGGLGGGDLKLYAAIGALCQPMLGIEVQMYSLLVAAIAAPAKLAYEGRLFRVLGQTLSLVFNPLRSANKRRPVPRETLTWFRMGPSIFVGGAVTLLIHSYSFALP